MYTDEENTGAQSHRPVSDLSVNGESVPKGEIPLGLGMALAQDMQAMEFFMSLSDERRESIINRAHTVNSSDEMRALVSALSNHTTEA